MLYLKEEQFFELIYNQFNYGGKKYAFNNEKESTDCLFDDFSKNWVYGTMAKYARRSKNLKRERDILKISCYTFLLFLKRGFHLSPKGTKTPINTTVDIKSKYFPAFKGVVMRHLTSTIPPESVSEDMLYLLFKSWANKDWEELTKEDLMESANMCFAYWNENFANSNERDEDVYNENKLK